MKKLVVRRDIDLDVLLKYGFVKHENGNYEYGCNLYNEYGATAWLGIVVLANNTNFIDIDAYDLYIYVEVDNTQKETYVNGFFNVSVIYELIKDEIIFLEKSRIWK